MILRALLALWTSVARPMGDHLWQSTLFLAVAAILALSLRKNQARVRYWVWLTASVKFLIPFSLLIALGSHLARPRVSTPAQVIVYSTVEDFSQPFAGQQMPVIYHPAPTAAPVSLLHLLPATLVAVWLVGIIVVLLRWAIGWVRISLMVRKAAPVSEGPEVDALRRLESTLDVRRPIRLVLSPDWMEPGIFGIFRPVLIWPEGISQHLDDRHIEAILAHEVCHARRNDNLTAVLHMLVEAVFWFHPLVWWMGARLEEERERACDEEVSLLCDQPHVYAESILRVCKFCSESPLACVSGITGADLKKRIVQIMTERVARKLDLRRKLMLLAVAAAAVVAPVALGLARMPLIFGQILKVNGPRPSFEVASIHVWKRPAPPPEAVGGEQVIHQQTMKFSPGNGGGQTSDHVHIIAPLGVLIAQAYGLPPGSDGRGDGRIVGGPDWMTQDDEQYDIQAKIDEQEYAAIQKMAPEQQREQVNLMKQSLLADRFKLKVHFETREQPAYALVAAKGGPKLTAAKDGESTKLSSTRQGQTTEMSATGTTLALFAESPLLSGVTGNRTVLDQTGLKGKYDFTLKWGANSGAGQEPSDEPALFTAIQEQLGLKLVPTKGPVEVIVIDHIEKPTVDGAGVSGQANVMPVSMAQEKRAPPAQDSPSPIDSYSVASVKPSAAGVNQGGQAHIGDTSIEARNMPLKYFIKAAYGVQNAQIVGGPAWINSQLFDVVAKSDQAVAATGKDWTPAQRRSFELRGMLPLQNLLADRFGLKVHFEDRQTAVYALVVAKGGPKLQPAGTIKEIYGSASAGIRALGPGQLAAMQSTTAQFARFLDGFSSQELGRLVVDKTGLTATYDFRLRWTPDPVAASDAAGATGTSLFTALQEQLGLRLEPQKAPVRTLVIDYVQMPSPN